MASVLSKHKQHLKILERYHFYFLRVNFLKITASSSYRQPFRTLGSHHCADRMIKLLISGSQESTLIYCFGLGQRTTSIISTFGNSGLS